MRSKDDMEKNHLRSIDDTSQNKLADHHDMVTVFNVVCVSFVTMKLYYAIKWVVKFYLEVTYSQNKNAKLPLDGVFQQRVNSDA